MAAAAVLALALCVCAVALPAESTDGATTASLPAEATGDIITVTIGTGTPTSYGADDFADAIADINGALHK